MNLYKEVEVPADMDHLDDVMGIIQEIMSNVEVDEAERMKALYTFSLIRSHTVQ